MNDSKVPRNGLLWLSAIAVVLGIVLLIRSCGEDESGDTTVAAGSWEEQAEGYCRDGLQEATSLALPSSAREVAADAEARIQIVATVRDGLYTLGEPTDLDPARTAIYVDQLTGTLNLLDQVREAARSGGDYQEINASISESSGQTAADLGLENCAAFAQAVARTP